MYAHTPTYLHTSFIYRVLLEFYCEICMLMLILCYNNVAISLNL